MSESRTANGATGTAWRFAFAMTARYASRTSAASLRRRRITPASVFDYDMTGRTLALLKQTEVLGGYDRTRYRSERVFATAEDGTHVAISLVYRLDAGIPPGTTPNAGIPPGTTPVLA